MINRIIKYFTYPFFAKRDGISRIKYHLKKLQEHETMNEEQIRDYQLERLRFLITFAYNYSAFYRKRMDKHGIKPEDIKSFEDFSYFPVLKKTDVITHLEEIKTTYFKQSEIHTSRSGGTTGNLLTFYRNNSSLGPKEAALLYFEQWAGWDFGKWKAYVWPVTLDIHPTSGIKYYIRNFLYQRVLTYPAFVVHEKEALVFLNTINQKKVKFIRAFPGVLKEVALIAKKYDLKFSSIEGIVTTGEILTEETRNILEEVFQADVYNSYRTRETGLLAQECIARNGLHLNTAHTYLEVVDPETKKPIYVRHGNILVTDFNNLAMPFIRYEIGDIGLMDNNDKCSCGRHMPRLKEFGGRLSDILYTIDGKKLVSISVIPIMFDKFKISNKFQVIQEDYDKLKIRLTPPHLSNSVIEKQLEVAKQMFGKSIKIKYEYVDDIQKLESGKYPIIVCKIEGKK